MDGGDKMDTYEICMLGPSHSGKTTLLASMIRDFENITDSIYKKNKRRWELRAKGTTYARTEDCINVLETGIRNGEFASECLPGTSTHDTYELEIKYNSILDQWFSPDIGLQFHDFPGGWINDPKRMEAVNFNKAEIFLLPVDATLLMEPISASERVAAARQLSIHQISNVVKRWAETRRDDNQRGLFIIAPLKCETYFPPKTSILEDKSQELFKRIRSEDYFGQMIEYLKETCPQIERCYMPIDTVGCCFITRKNWKDDKQGKLLEVTYRVPTGKQWSPYGPARIMFKILHHVALQSDGWLSKTCGCTLKSKIEDLENRIPHEYEYNRGKTF